MEFPTTLKKIKKILREVLEKNWGLTTNYGCDLIGHFPTKVRGPYLYIIMSSSCYDKVFSAQTE